MQQPPTANEFLQTFLEAFNECLGEANETDNVWQNWTAFMTGKNGKNAGRWEKKPVLEKTAEKLGLKHNREYLALDSVLFPAGDAWGNFVALEHEHCIANFDEEITKLMSVLAPLKVGITYDFREDPGAHARLLKLIEDDFNARHPAVLEAPQTEYLFVLGVGKASDTLRWKYLTFACGAGPGNEFVDVDKNSRVAGLNRRTLGPVDSGI